MKSGVIPHLTVDKCEKTVENMWRKRAKNNGDGYRCTIIYTAPY